MKVHPSALKHDLDTEDALCAASAPVFVDDLSDDPLRQLRLGFDTHGRLLEVVVLTFDSGNQLVIHAMKARTKYVRMVEGLI